MSAEHRVGVRVGRIRVGRINARLHVACAIARLVTVQRFASREFRLQIRRQRIISSDHTRENGIATIWRNRDRMQQRCHARLFEIAHIGMKKHFAVGQRTDIFAVFALVGDVHDGRMCRALVFFQRMRERSKAFGKMYLLHVIKRLTPE